MKKQVHFLNAHSEKMINLSRITLDAQVEFKIIDPMVIYHIDTFDDGNREPIRIYVDNAFAYKFDYKSRYEEIQKLIDEKLAQRNKEVNQDYFKSAILIERIVISAFEFVIKTRTIILHVT